MNKIEKIIPEDCYRLEGDYLPTEYDRDECQDCTCWDCPFMPEGAEQEWCNGVMDSMFPDGMDDGFDVDDFFGGN